MFLYSCSDSTVSIDIPVINSYEDSVLRSKDFISRYEKLPDSCASILKNKVEDFYTNAGDSISNIYSLDARFYPDHYSKNESESIAKFSLFVYRPDKTEIIYFGVRKNTSDIIFLNELEINESKRILSKEEHVVFVANLSQLEAFDCIDLELEKSLTDEEETFRSISTFDHNENQIWVVDSIQDLEANNSWFARIDSFNIVNNKYIVFRDTSIEFFFKDFDMYLINSKDTIPSRFISYSDDFRILQETHEKSNPWVYLRKLD